MILDAFLKKCETDGINMNVKNEQAVDELKTPGDKSADDVIGGLPWHENGIYLEDKNKAVKAVCSNQEIAKILASCMEYYSSLNVLEGSKAKAYGKFIQDSYYLYMAMSNAKIPVNSVETVFVEKAFHQFCNSLNEIITREHLSFESVTGLASAPAQAPAPEQAYSVTQQPEINQTAGVNIGENAEITGQEK